MMPAAVAGGTLLARRALGLPDQAPEPGQLSPDRTPQPRTS
jgi:hypothetical protein